MEPMEARETDHATEALLAELQAIRDELQQIKLELLALRAEILKPEGKFVLFSDDVCQQIADKVGVPREIISSPRSDNYGSAGASISALYKEAEEFKENCSKGSVMENFDGR